MAMAATGYKLHDMKDDQMSILNRRFQLLQIEKVMVSAETICNLPEDILHDILSRLPVKDLLRFRCVSKSLRALIDSPSFISAHHSVQYAIHKAHGDVPLLLCVRPTSLRGYRIECHLLSKELGGDDTILNWTSDLQCLTNSVFPNDPDILLNIFCQGSANGIICLEFWGYDSKTLGRDFFSAALWNPASREFKVIANLHVPNQIMPGQFRVVGFGVDPLSNDFKIVATTTVESVSYIFLVYMVYTLSTNSWKKVSQPCLFGSIARVNNSALDACLNGVYYWTANLKSDSKMFRILSYNFSTEVFRFSDPPQEALPPLLLDYMSRGDEFFMNIGLYNECLALFIINNVYGAPGASAEIWVVSEFDNNLDVPLAWQCVISIDPIYEEIGSIFGPQRMDGDILFEIRSNSELSLYNPTTGKFRKLGIRFRGCFSYVESLFPLSRRVVAG